MRNFDFATEWPKILDLSSVYGVDPYAVAAIRVAENGAAGREFGVLSIPAPDYSSQLRAACVSLRNEIIRWGSNGFIYDRRLCYTHGFAVNFAKRWAPPLVANDPTNLNENWLANFWSAYLGFVDLGGPLTWQEKHT